MVISRANIADDPGFSSALDYRLSRVWDEGVKDGWGADLQYHFRMRLRWLRGTVLVSASHFCQLRTAHGHRLT